MKVKHILSQNNLNLEVFSSLKSGPSSASLKLWGENFCHSLAKYLKDSTLFSKNLRLYWSKNILTLSVTLCADGRMKSLNQKFRQKNKTTDVLSFPLHEDLHLHKGKVIFPINHLGDIIISYPMAQKQAHEFKITVEDEFYHLATHGALHLLGLDHERSLKEEILMKKEENKILKYITNIKKRKKWKTH